MRVCFITSELTPTHGWGRHSLDLIRHLIDAGVRAVAITPVGDDGGGLPLDAHHPILPSPADGRRWFTPRSLLKIPAVHRAARNCDLIHCLVEPYAPMAALAAWGKPLIITAHGSYSPLSIQRRLIGPLFRWAHRRADAIICVSGFTASRLRPLLPDAPITVIRNGVHWQEFAKSAPAPPIKSRPLLIGVGAVKPRKGYDLVIEALPKVREKYPGARYVIIGNTDWQPEYVESLLERARELGVDDAVELAGRVSAETLRGYYHHADLFVMTPVEAGKKFEGFGLVYLEAGAAGLPVIGTYGSGAEDAIEHGVNGLLVPPGDPQALANAITRVLDDRELARRLGKGGQSRAMASGWDNVASRTIELYGSCVSAKLPEADA